MAERIAHWIADSWDELRVLTPYAAAALLTGGSISSALLALVWLFQHHRRAESRP